MGKHSWRPNISARRGCLLLLSLHWSPVKYLSLSSKPKITITMPAAVPPAVARSFKVLLPIFCHGVLSALNYCLTLISPAGLNDLIYTLIQTPLKHMGTNIFAVIILGAVGNFLWVLGIHGPNTTSAIRETVFLRLIWRISPGPLNMALPGARHIRLPGLLLMMHSPTAAVQVWRWGYCWLFYRF